MAASALALAVSGYLTLPGNKDEGDYARLLARGWEWIDGLSCPAAGPGYFAVESEAAAAEGYLGPDGRWLVSGAPPEPPYDCRKITQPTFIQEVR